MTQLGKTMTKKYTLLSGGILSVALLASLLTTSTSAMGMEKTDLSFQAAFPKPFYEKSYFPFVLMGTTVVAAGVVTYATGGAGAPAAATGVSTVASWVGGGGAGSYMAGLSTIGGLVGGNAVTGAAILNGVSIGLGGGTAAFAKMTTLGQASVLASMSASVLDGVMFYQPEGQKLTVSVRLEIPVALSSGYTEKLAESLGENTKEMAKAIKAKEEAIKAKEEAIVAKEELRIQQLIRAKQNIDARTIAAASRMLKRRSVNIGNAVILAVMAKNMGRHDLGDALILKIPSNYLSRKGYYNYMLGVISVQNGNIPASKKYLWRSMKAEKYAIEPVILYTSILANEDFKKNRISIINTGARFANLYDSDKYKTGYGLSSLYFRIGSIHLSSHYFRNSEFWFRKAEDELSWFQAHVGDKTVRNLIRLGIAQSLCGQRKPKSSNKIMAEIKKDGGIPSTTKSNLACAI